MKLNLACGEQHIEGWQNWDISPEVLPDKVVNLLKFPWECEKDSVSEIFCSHFVEHIGDEFIPFMEECHRVLEPGGTVHIVAPYYTSIRAWQDPTHKRPISEFTFQYFSDKWRKSQGVGHYPIKCDFGIHEIRYHYPNEMKEMDQKEVQWLRQHAWNTVADIEIILRAIKDDKQAQVM